MWRGTGNGPVVGPRQHSGSLSSDKLSWEWPELRLALDLLLSTRLYREVGCGRRGCSQQVRDSPAQVRAPAWLPTRDGRPETRDLLRPHSQSGLGLHLFFSLSAPVCLPSSAPPCGTHRPKSQAQAPSQGSAPQDSTSGGCRLSWAAPGLSCVPVSWETRPRPCTGGQSC